MCGYIDLVMKTTKYSMMDGERHLLSMVVFLLFEYLLDENYAVVHPWNCFEKAMFSTCITHPLLENRF